MSVKGGALPWMRLTRIDRQVDDLRDAATPRAAEFALYGTDERIRGGGVWRALHARYIPGQRPDHVRTVWLHRAQWQFLQYILEAIDQQIRGAGPIPLQDIIMHGGRRSGKSVALAAAVLMWAIARPASNIWIMSLRQRHGKRIIALLKRWLPPESWSFEKRENTLWLSNYSHIRAMNVQEYDNERGDSVERLGIAEAAFVREAVFMALAPSILDRDGVVAMSSSPNGYNWFYDRAMLAKSKDEKKRKSVRVCTLSTLENVFLSKSAKNHAEHLQHVMSADAYRQEVLGQFVPPTGKALPDFREDNVQTVISGDGTELGGVESRFAAMETLGDLAFDMRRLHYIVGVDFNMDPISGVIVQFDDQGRMYVVGEHYSSQGTEQWAVGLSNKLKALGCESPHEEAILVADASGQWQGVGTRPKQSTPTWAILRHLGWRVVQPSVHRRRNPHRLDRMEVMGALTRSAAGEVRLFVDPEAEFILETLKRLELSNGIPSLKSKYIHAWDAVSYAAYRIWGTPTGRVVYGHELVGSFDGEVYHADTDE